MLEPVSEHHRRLSEAPVGENVTRHRLNGPAGLILAETALQQPPLIGIGIGVVADGIFQDSALDGNSDRVGSGISLPSPAAPLGGLEGREKPSANLRGAHWH